MISDVKGKLKNHFDMKYLGQPKKIQGEKT